MTEVPGDGRPPPVRDSIDVTKCLRMGAIGALGAIPGTMCAHPCDVVKIRMQTMAATGASSGSLALYRDTFSHILRSGASSSSSASASAATPSASGGGIVNTVSRLRPFYNGLTPAIEQRIVARGPMFLFSELYTQLVESSGAGLSGTQARFVGSVGSGYTTGFLAGLAEYRKKLLSQRVISPSEARWDRLVGSAVKAGQGTSLMRRLNAAGVCSATYDSFFFGTQHELRENRGWATPTSYAAAAAAAVCCSFALDTTVARMMVVPPSQAVEPFRVMLRKVLRGPGAGYRGLAARVVEFSISYLVTGVVASAVLAAGVTAATSAAADEQGQREDSNKK